MTLFQHIRQAYKNWRVGGADSSSYEWGGISWEEFVRQGGGGVGVTEDSARAVASVTACVNLIGGSIASLPLHFYRRTDTGRDRYTPDFWWLFNERPYGNWSAAAFWQYLSDSKLFHGDGFARIHRASRLSNTIAGIEPRHPTYTEVDRVGNRNVYTFHPQPCDPEGTKAVTVDQDDVLHIPGPGFDGRRGLSQLSYGLRHAAGIALEADRQSASFFTDGSRPDVALEVPGDLPPDKAEVLRKSFMERHAGQNNKRVPIVLAGGVKLHQLTMTNEDAELLATRGFQIEEVCRVFGVPPHMVGHTEKTTSFGSGVEQMGIGFVKYTLQRHLVAIEQEINFKLFKTSRNFAEFVTAGLERGDLKARNESYRIALGRAGEPGWMSVNEVRALENLPPIDGGEKPATNMPVEPTE
jgi:HK97 family phage portal protein